MGGITFRYQYSSSTLSIAKLQPEGIIHSVINKMTEKSRGHKTKQKMRTRRIYRICFTVLILVFSCNSKEEVLIEDPILTIQTDDDGNIQLVGYMISGKREGEWRVFTQERLFSIRNYKNDIPHGREINYEIDSGKVLEEGSWNNGQRVGLWYFYQNGILVSISEYENDDEKIIYHNPDFKNAGEIPPPPPER
jgi:antitoxin component YwqK of YwqJK toxin-antitoxin module